MNDLMQFVEVSYYKSVWCLVLTSFGTLKYDCVINTIETFNVLPLINNSVTTGVSFLLLIISANVSSKTINTLRFLPRLYSLIFL